MTRDVSALAHGPFDLLIVGGGIVGAGIAWDASLRGLSCALVEQGDFASGTSSKTTKLIHGGIRYLEQLEFRLVSQAIRERKILLDRFGQLVKPLPFLIPVIGSSPRPWPWVKWGVMLYDLLAGARAIAPHRFLSGKLAKAQEPLLAQVPVRKAAVYTDAQMDDARLVLTVLEKAWEAGAKVVNHCRVVEWIFSGGKIAGAQVEDRLTGKRYTIKAKGCVNATGPWVDQLRKLADRSVTPLVRMSKGIHLVYPDLGLKQALLLSSAKDRRIFFLIPWRGMTLIGTTDTDYSGDPAQAQATAQDVAYLMEETQKILPHLRLDRAKAISTFAGVRPLVAQEKRDPWAVSRGHLIYQDSNGLISVAGGKFTTFRKIAEEAVDRAAAHFPGRSLAPCSTAQVFQDLSQRAEKIRQWITEEPSLAEPVCSHHPFTQAEIRWAVEEEMCLSLSDLLWRRLEIGWSACQGLDALEPACERMGRYLGWSDEEKLRQKRNYEREIALAHQAL